MKTNTKLNRRERFEAEGGILPPPTPPALRFKVASDEEIAALIADDLAEEKADALEERLAEHPALHVHVLGQRADARRRKEVEKDPVNVIRPDRIPAHAEIASSTFMITFKQAAGDPWTERVSFQRGSYLINATFEKRVNPMNPDAPGFLIATMTVAWQGASPEMCPETPPPLCLNLVAEDGRLDPLGEISTWVRATDSAWLGRMSIEATRLPEGSSQLDPQFVTAK